MKKISLLFILIIVLVGITTLTTYTLMHQDIKGEETIKKIKSIEKATSNMTSNELSEIYNIELDGKRHKLKCVYRVNFEKKEASINLVLYLDGFEILNKEIEDNFKAEKIEEIFNDESDNELLIKESNLKIINSDKDYLLVEVFSNIDSLKGEYFIWNANRKAILENVLVYDEALEYSNITDEDFDIFYADDKQVLAKIEDNHIYALEEKEEDNLILEEYIYTIKNDKAQKELINTYEVKKEK